MLQAPTKISTSDSASLIISFLWIFPWSFTVIIGNVLYVFSVSIPTVNFSLFLCLTAMETEVPKVPAKKKEPSKRAAAAQKKKPLATVSEISDDDDDDYCNFRVLLLLLPVLKKLLKLHQQEQDLKGWTKLENKVCVEWLWKWTCHWGFWIWWSDWWKWKQENKNKKQK